MSSRSRWLALALAVACPLPGLAQGFAYAPSSGQFRITATTKGAQEMMGQRQDYERSSNRLISLTVRRPATDTLVMTAVVDSISVVGPMGMTPPGVDQLRGATVVSKLSPNGILYTAEGPDTASVPLAGQLTEELSRILPRIHAVLAPGASWTDTTTIAAKQGGMTLSRRLSATYTVVGDTTVGSEKSWKISRETTTAISGSGDQGGQQMTLEGTSSGKGIVVISQASVYLGMAVDEQTDIKVVLAANGMEIGVTESTSARVEKIGK